MDNDDAEVGKISFGTGVEVRGNKIFVHWKGNVGGRGGFAGMMTSGKGAVMR